MRWLFSVVDMKLIIAGILFVALTAGCVSQQEIKLDMSCSVEGVSEACTAACSGNYTAELDAWRCSATGYPVCVCKAYKESGQFIG